VTSAWIKKGLTVKVSQSVALAVLNCVWHPALAAGQSSTNYQVSRASVNAGVEPMASASYQLVSTLGQPFGTGTLYYWIAL
jgi:hypothetical protein